MPRGKYVRRQKPQQESLAEKEVKRLKWEIEKLKGLVSRLESDLLKTKATAFDMLSHSFVEIPVKFP